MALSHNLSAGLCGLKKMQGHNPTFDPREHGMETCRLNA
jgi:hypothetical protein